MKKREIPVMNIGIPLIILVFITLCLLTFSVLSLENAAADRRLSQKAADHTTAYYEAVNRIQNRMKEVWETKKDNEDWKEGTEISLEESVSGGQKLAVSITATGEKDKPYEVTQWKLEPSEEWEADRSLDIYKGE